MSRMFVADDTRTVEVEITNTADDFDDPQYVGACSGCPWTGGPADTLEDAEQEAAIHVDHQH